MGDAAKALRRGYTLTEMMVVVLLIAVVSAYALPAIDGFLSSQKVEAEGRLLAENIRLGRYKALQEQVLHRIAFDVEGGYVLGYKVEAYVPYDNEAYLDLDIGLEVATSSVDVVRVPLSYDSGAKWASVMDQDEVVFDGAVEVTVGSGLNGMQNVIYFYPTGYLVSAPVAGVEHVVRNDAVAKVDELVFTFTYGNAQARVYVNALGVLSSESYALGAYDE